MKDDPNYEIYTFDINNKKEHQNQHCIDLTREDILFYLERYFPKPDIIVSSPNCAAFSVINNVGEGERIGITKDFQVRELNEIQEIIDTHKFFKHRKAERERDSNYRVSISKKCS